MIVLLDIEKQTLSLYGRKGMIEIPFTQAGSMYDYLEGENVTYITNAMECNASDIINVIKSMGVVIQDDVQETGVKYLHSPEEGTIYIEEEFQFKGKFDCKIIDARMTQIIEASSLLQNLIRNKKIEIIGERKRASLMRQFKQYQNNQLEKQGMADAQLNGMILQTKVADWDGTVDGAKGHESAIIVDVGGAGRVGTGAGGLGPAFNTMSELMDAVDGLD